MNGKKDGKAKPSERGGVMARAPRIRPGPWNSLATQRDAAAESGLFRNGDGALRPAIGNLDGRSTGPVSPSPAAGSRFSCDFCHVQARAPAADKRAVGEAEREEGLIVDARGGDAGGASRDEPGQPGAGSSAEGSNGQGPRVFMARVRADTTPAGMPDRIPPRVNTPVMVAVAGLRPSMNPVTFSVDRAGGDSGSARVNGANRLEVTGDGISNLRLSGVEQTSPGSDGELNLLAEQGETELARSNPFSVAAVPEYWSCGFKRLLTGEDRGFVVQDRWQSDSRSVTDLDQVSISEQVQVTEATGCFSGVGGSTSGYLTADTFTTDTHSTPADVLTDTGRRVATQTSKFRDNRTGVTDMPMARSGYVVTRTVTRTVPIIGTLRIQTRKVGRATTANRISSGAGFGSITRSQAV
jgi:hypothetical protein